MSDVICDLCIRPSDTKLAGEHEEVQFDFSVEENPVPSSSSSSSKLITPPRLDLLELSARASDTTMVEAFPTSITAGSAQQAVEGRPRQRKRSRLKVPRVDPADLVPDAASVPASSALSPRSHGLHPVSVVPPLRSSAHGRQLTPEQNALLSGCISLCAAAAVGFQQQGHSASSASGLASLFRADAAGALAAVGGCFHFSAYLATLCAFSSASSTVITPLMQLSAMWMLPFSTSAALLGFASFIRPVHLLSVAFIITGGFLPAAHGSLAYVASSTFWKQSAVRYVVLGELLICCYNVLLHQATFGLFSQAGDQQAVISPSDPYSDSEGMGSTLRFFLVSRTMNGLSCICLFLTVPSLRDHARALRGVGAGFFATSLVGECLSTLGVCLVTFSYSSFYEPSVVNAVEGGLQQLFNLIFALATHRIFGWGPGVDQINVKIVSFVLVAVGLFLSTI